MHWVIRLSLFTLRRLIALLILSVMLSSTVHAYDPLEEKLPDCPVIPGATWYWIGKSMVVNDMPMSIKYFEYQGQEEAIAEFYTKYWKTSGHGAVNDRKFGNTRIISQELDGFFSSVQMIVSGSVVTGKIVVSLSPSSVKRNGKTILPLPPGSTIASRVQSKDGALYSETLTLIAQRSVDFTWSYYQNQLAGAGWGKVKEDKAGTHVTAQFQSESGLLQITIKPLPGQARNQSQILVHWMK